MLNCHKYPPLTLPSSKPSDTFIVCTSRVTVSYTSSKLEESVTGVSSHLRDEGQGREWRRSADGLLITRISLAGFTPVLCAAALADSQSSWKVYPCLWVSVPILQPFCRSEGQVLDVLLAECRVVVHCAGQVNNLINLFIPGLQPWSAEQESWSKRCSICLWNARHKLAIFKNLNSTLILMGGMLNALIISGEVSREKWSFLN